MANCPKCGEKLRLIDWKQHCPHCGANIFVYDLQERLMKQADIAEVQYYHFQKKIDRVKAAFIGTKLAVVRIFACILPVGPIFLPLINAVFREPHRPYEGKLSIMTIVSEISNADMGAVVSFGNGRDNTLFALSFILFALSAVLTLLHFILLTLSCSPKGKPRNIITDSLILLTTIGSIVCFSVMGDTGYVSGTLGIGAWLYLAAQIINVVIDLITLHKGIEVHHKQCYCGGIPIEEYFEMVEKGMTTEEIREIQYEHLLAQQKEKEEELARMEEKQKAEKEAREAGKDKVPAEEAVQDSDLKSDNPGKDAAPEETAADSGDETVTEGDEPADE